ncbi:hypothetical protein Nhal_2671 [Nitrosococcus halophilus Nc 4]|uniref:Uncharacterized protein n=1 Tax=Nitrosococcus halophilus (strain Nc4) TaxID=472759 RepID=D5BX64_NITHN|nr:hypothetical protein Nhal_2671 [Nitrosococcus halophilus Nc 4]
MVFLDSHPSSWCACRRVGTVKQRENDHIAPKTSAEILKTNESVIITALDKLHRFEPDTGARYYFHSR